jgi:hypothetical protein
MRVAGFILLFSVLAVCAQTNTPNYCHYPIRSFGGRGTVNLTPLFQWWMAHDGKKTATPDDYADTDRPLSSWSRITGVKVAELENSWLVDAVIATSPTTRTNEQIILKNPPATDEQQYYALEALLPEYNLQITNDARAYQADLKAERNADAHAGADARSMNWRARVNAGNYSQLAARKRDAADAALSDEKQYEQARDWVMKQLNVIPSVGGRYKIDCFALEIGRNRQGLPVYDVGMPYIDGP